MKITKSQLKQIIKEEFGKVKTAAVRKGTAQDVKQKVAGGITDQERGIIQKLQNQLAQAAQTGNIASGAIMRWATRLSQELEKVTPDQQQQQQAQPQQVREAHAPIESEQGKLVHVEGYGYLGMNQVKMKLIKMLQEAAHDALGDPATFPHLNGGVIQALHKTLKDNDGL